MATIPKVCTFKKSIPCLKKEDVTKRIVQQRRVALHRVLHHKITQKISFDIVLYSLTLCSDQHVRSFRERINYLVYSFTWNTHHSLFGSLRELCKGLFRYLLGNGILSQKHINKVEEVFNRILIQNARSYILGKSLFV